MVQQKEILERLSKCGQMLTTEQSRQRIYGSLLYNSFNFSVGLKFFNIKC